MELLMPAAVLLAAPVALLVFARAHAGVMFMAACAGVVLLQSMDPVVLGAAAAVIPSEGIGYARLGVVLLSVALTAFIFRGRVHSLVQMLIHVMVILLLGAMLWLILPSYTGLSWLLSSMQHPLWAELFPFKTVIVGAGFGLSILTLLTIPQRSKRSKSKKHKD